MCIRDIQHGGSCSEGVCHTLKHQEQFLCPDKSSAYISYSQENNRLVTDVNGLQEIYAVVWTNEAVVRGDVWNHGRWQISRSNGRFKLTNTCDDVRLRPVVRTVDSSEHIPIPLNGSFLLSNGDQILLNNGNYHCKLPHPILNDWMLPARVYDKITYTGYDISNHILGAGTFVKVYLGINIVEHRQVACKIVCKSTSVTLQESDLLIRLKKHVS